MTNVLDRATGNNRRQFLRMTLPRKFLICKFTNLFLKSNLSSLNIPMSPQFFSNLGITLVVWHTLLWYMNSCWYCFSNCSQSRSTMAIYCTSTFWPNPIVLFRCLPVYHIAQILLVCLNIHLVKCYICVLVIPKQNRLIKITIVLISLVGQNVACSRLSYGRTTASLFFPNPLCSEFLFGLLFWSI